MPRHTQAQLLALLSSLESFNEFISDPQITALWVDGKQIKHIESLVIIKDATQALHVYALAKNFKQDELRGDEVSFRGGEGKVYIAQHTATGQWVALKECYSLHAKNAYLLARELLKSTNTIIDILATGVAKNNYYYVVMERAKMTFGSLTASSLSADERQALLKQTLDFTKTLANNRVAYLDVKSRNFMLSYTHQLKVCDLEGLTSINDDEPSFTYLLNVFAWLYNPSEEIIRQLRAALLATPYRREFPQAWYEAVLKLFIEKGAELEAKLGEGVTAEVNFEQIIPHSYGEMHWFIFKLDLLVAQLSPALTVAQLRTVFFALMHLFAEPIGSIPLINVEVDRVKKTLISLLQTVEDAFTERLLAIIGSKDADWLMAIIKLGLDCERYNASGKTLLDLVIETNDEKYALSILSAIPKSSLVAASNGGSTLTLAIKLDFLHFTCQLLAEYQAMAKQLNRNVYVQSNIYKAIRFAIQSEKVSLLAPLLKVYGENGYPLKRFMIDAIGDKKYKVVEYFAARADIDVEENQGVLTKEKQHHSLLSFAVAMNDARLVAILLQAKRAPMLNQESISPLAVAIQARADVTIVFQLALVSAAKDLRNIFPLSGGELKQWIKINKPLFMDRIIRLLEEKNATQDKKEWLRKVLTPGSALHLAIASHDSTIPFNFSWAGISEKTHSILQLEERLQKLSQKPAAAPVP